MPINLSSVFLPGRQASSKAFWLGLGLLALFDAVRLSVFPAGSLLLWLFVSLLSLIALQNRIRVTRRARAFVIAGVILAVLSKAIVSIFVTAMALYPDFMAFLQTQGVDVLDTRSLNTAAYDPNLQAAYTQRLEANPDLVQSIAEAGAWPSTWGYWLVLAFFARQIDRPASLKT